MNTKENILLEALKFFAHDGYEGVSVRNIAKQLGITQAALYKHYSSKQDIFDSIVKHMNDDYIRRVEALGMPEGSSLEIAGKYEEIPLEAIINISEQQFLYWTQDEYASCFRKMLILEQYRNKQMSDLYQKNFGTGVIEYISSLFQEMINNGFFRKEDARLLAINFYSPIYMMMTLYDGSDNKEEVIKMVKEHVEQFTRNYKK